MPKRDPPAATLSERRTSNINKLRPRGETHRLQKPELGKATKIEVLNCPRQAHDFIACQTIAAHLLLRRRKKALDTGVLGPICFGWASTFVTPTVSSGGR